MNLACKCTYKLTKVLWEKRAKFVVLLPKMEFQCTLGCKLRESLFIFQFFKSQKNIIDRVKHLLFGRLSIELYEV